MKLRILEQDIRSMKFIVEGVSTSMVNSLRRVLMSHLPKLAIHKVEFHMGPIRDEEGGEYESMSPLFDEMVAHRLGLVPIPADPKLFNIKEECVCEGEGCPNCEIMYRLNKHGPCTVYSGDLEPIGMSGDSVEPFRVKDDLIPIVKLGPSQALLIYATAVKGTARKHAKWQVANSVGYQHYPIVTIDHDICDDGGGCINVCPKDVLGYNTRGKVVVKNLEACNLCKACVQICEPAKFRGGKKGEIRKAITVSNEENKFIFQFETDGSYTARHALETGLIFLEDKFKDFRQSISKLK